MLWCSRVLQICFVAFAEPLCRILTTDVSNIYNAKPSYLAHYSNTHETILQVLNEFCKHDTELPKLIQTNIEDNNKEIEFSVNRNSFYDDNKKQYDPVNLKFFEFEWKILDQIPLNDAANITLFVIMIAQHLADNPITIDNDPREAFKTNHHWPMAFFKEILSEGWNATPNFVNYDALLQTNLKFGNHIPENPEHVFALLSGLYTNLYTHYQTLNPESNSESKSIIHCFSQILVQMININICPI